MGEYITYVDGDDTVNPDFFEKAVNELDGGGYDFVQGNHQKIYEDRVVPCVLVANDEVIADRKEMLGHYLDVDHKTISYGVWGKVFREDIVRRTQFNADLACSEDVQYTFDVLMPANRIKLRKDVSIHLCKEKDSRASQVRRQILKCPIRQLWPQMSPSARRRVLLHRFAGPLYDLYFMCLRNSNPSAKPAGFADVLLCLKAR